MQSLKQNFKNAPSAQAPGSMLGHRNELGHMLERDMSMKQAVGHHITSWGFTSDIGVLHEGSHILLLIASQDPKGRLQNFPYQNHWDAEVYVFALESLIKEFESDHSKHISSDILEDYQAGYERFRDRVCFYAEFFQKEVNKDRKKRGNHWHYTQPEEDEMRGLYRRLQPMLIKIHDAVNSPENLKKCSYTLSHAEVAMHGLNIRDLTRNAWNTRELFLDPNHNIYMEAL